MKSSFFALASSVFVAFASAWTTPVGSSPQGNPISRPGLGEMVPVGQPYTITWNPTSTGTVTILFLKGPSTNVIPQYAIAQNIPNTGSYVWTPPTDTVPGTSGYGIQLIDDATGFYQYSTQFGISNNQLSSSSSSSVISTSSTSSSSSSSVSSSNMTPTTTTSTSTTTSTTTSTSTSTTSTTSCTSSTSSSLSYSTPAPFSAEEATTVIHTNMVTITSCAPTVTNCPAKSITPAAPSSTPVIKSPITYWSNSTLAAAATSTQAGIASTGFGASASASTTTKFTGAGEKIRVGCAMGAVLVAAFALAL